MPAGDPGHRSCALVAWTRVGTSGSVGSGTRPRWRTKPRSPTRGPANSAPPLSAARRWPAAGKETDRKSVIAPPPAVRSSAAQHHRRSRHRPRGRPRSGPTHTDNHDALVLELGQLRHIVPPTGQLITTRERRPRIRGAGQCLCRPRHPTSRRQHITRPNQPLARDTPAIVALAPTNRRSTNTTDNPPSVHRPATVSPAGPAPITITSMPSMAVPTPHARWGCADPPT